MKIEKLDQQEYDKNQQLFVYNGIFSSGYNTLTVGVFLTGYAFLLGATDSQAGMIASIIHIASIFQILLVKWWHKRREAKKTIIGAVFLARILLLTVVLIPLLNVKRFSIEVPLFGVMNGNIVLFYTIVLIAMIIGSSSGVKMNLWMMSHLPRHIRGSYFTSRDRIIMYATLTLSLVASWFLDYMGYRQKTFEGYIVLFSVAVAFAFIDLAILRKIDFIQTDRLKGHSHPIEMSFLVPMKDKHFMKVVMYQMIWCVGINMTVPYFNVYMLKELNMSFSLITIFMIIQIVVSSFAIKYWGRLANEKRWIVILNTGLVCFILQLVVWLMVKPSTLYLIPLVFLMAGIFGPAYNMSVFNLPYSHMKKENEITYMSLNMTAVSFASMVGVLIGGQLLQHNEVFSTYLNHYLGINIILSILLIALAIIYSYRRIERIERDE